MPQTPSRRRRSARVLSHDPVIAPGYGTHKDLLTLSRELSRGQSDELSVDAVEALMKRRGRGQLDAAAAPAAATSNAWADFMAEEGVGGLLAAPASSNATTTTSSARVPAAGSAEPSSVQRNYHEELNVKPVKKAKPSANKQGGILVQAGTLDSSLVGRAKVKDTNCAYHLPTPTRIMSTHDNIARVFTSCNAVHSIAIDTEGKAYGWGRNEAMQLGADLTDDVVLPTPLELPGKVALAALGKSHTLVLLQDGTLYGVGANKVGQLGLPKNNDQVAQWRRIPLPETVTQVVQIACGEDFSVLLDQQGYIYTTGSSEYGQLGNGETGEYFVTANKIAFANCYAFTRRQIFGHAPKEKLHTTSEQAKVVPLNEDVRIASIACGKHHTLAVEALSQAPARVFSWGCGDYGCLGHGVQADEYFPRLIGALQQSLHVPVGVSYQVSAGAHCSLLMTSSGHVYYWGKHRSMGEATMRPQLVDVLLHNQHVVTHCAAGGQTVVCTTQAGQTVAWGQGPHNELGIGKAKSSSKPTFVEALDGLVVLDLACGYGHTLFMVSGDDKKRVQALKELSTNDIAPLIDAVEARGRKQKR